VRPADEIEADLAIDAPAPDAGPAAWAAWLERHEDGEVDDALMFRWLAGIAAATSGLVVSDEIASMPNLGWQARVVLAALQRAPAISGPEALDTATALIFGHEASSLRHIVEAGAVDLITAGALTPTRAGGFSL
jgi:hypothetical protein